MLMSPTRSIAQCLPAKKTVTPGVFMFGLLDFQLQNERMLKVKPSYKIYSQYDDYSELFVKCKWVGEKTADLLSLACQHPGAILTKPAKIACWDYMCVRPA